MCLSKSWPGALHELIICNFVLDAGGIPRESLTGGGMVSHPARQKPPRFPTHVRSLGTHRRRIFMGDNELLWKRKIRGQFVW